MTRRGFTLVELLVAMVIGTAVLGAIYQSIIGVQRLIASHSERIEVQQTLRAGAFYVGHVLRELSAGGGDITVAATDQIRFRGMRWSSVVCNTVIDHVTHVHLYLRDTMTSGPRAPDPTLDSILVFAQGNQSNPNDDRWYVGQMFTTTPDLCADATAATNIMVATVTVADKDSIVSGVTSGAPVRGFQMEELDVFPYWDSRPWLMRRLATNTGSWSGWEGLVGPLQSANGIEFTYYDAAGNVTAVRTNIASIGIEFRAESGRLAHSGTGTIDHLRDSLATRVALRNN